MSRDRSFAAVKKAIRGGSSFSGKRNVLVSMGERTFLYKDVFVSATYNIAYMQMDIDVVWEDDWSQPERLSQTLCKPAVWCRIEAAHRRITIWPERIAPRKKMRVGKRSVSCCR